jgi:hypothetical protein
MQLEKAAGVFCVEGRANKSAFKIPIVKNQDSECCDYNYMNVHGYFGKRV